MGDLLKNIAIPDEVVMSKIYVIRAVKIMLDRDLAELYGAETKYLKRQVKRVTKLGIKVTKKERGFLLALKEWVSTSSIR